MASDDDPFSVVKPPTNNVKMSQYIKKHKQRRETEESSHGTTSTRSTTLSNRTDDHKSTSAESHSSGNNSGLFGGHNSDGSFTNWGEEEEICDEDHHLSAAPIEFGLSEFGSGLEFGSTEGGRNALGRNSHHGSSGKLYSCRKDTARKPRSVKKLTSESGASKKDSKNNKMTIDLFASTFDSDPFGTGGDDEPVHFGDDDYGHKLFADDPFADFAEEGKSPGKLEDCKQIGKSKSHSNSVRRREPIPRRCNPSDAIDFGVAVTAASPGKPQSRRRLPTEQSRSERDVPPPRSRSGILRRSSLNLSTHGRNSKQDDEQSLFSTQTEPADPSKTSRRTRRSSCGYAHSDGSLDPAVSDRSLNIHPPPAPLGTPGHSAPRRQKSSMGTSMDPRIQVHKIRSRRPGNDGSSSNLSDFFSESSSSISVPRPPSDASPGNKDKKWATDRSRNQEMIMSMYKDGSATKKNNSPCEGNIGSSSDLGADLEALVINEKDLLPASEGTAMEEGGEKKRRSALSKLKKMTKRKDLQAPEEEEQPAMDARKSLVGRSRGTLLERVGATEEPSSRSSVALNKGGSSYSDRILMNRK